MEENRTMPGTVSDISSQIKTPLSGISLYTSLLLEGNLEAEEARALLMGIKNSVNRLQGLMERLFKMSRLEAGNVALYPEAGFLGKTIRDAIGFVQGRAQEKRMKLVLETFEDRKIVHDRMWTAEAIGSVLENAVKYGPADTAVRIRVQSFSCYTSVEITDYGLGIGQEERNYIFKRFYRGRNAQGTEGAGLGLYLASLILEKQKGSITVDSVPGKFCRFSLFLRNSQE